MSEAETDGGKPTRRMAIDTVVFDVGNVLIRWDPRHLFRKLLPDEAAVERFLAEVCTPAWNLAQDAGRSWADGVAEAIARRPDAEALIRAYDARWQETVPDAIAGSVAALARLKAEGVPVYAITNFSAEKWADSLVRFPFLRSFDGAIVSAHERVTKPDPAIYRLLIARYGVAPERAVFVDDSAANVAAAEALGFRAIRFTPETDLVAELASFGLPVGRSV